MSSIDQRVVEMKFNNGAFSKGISDTLSALTRLQAGLKLPGAAQGAQQAEAGISQLGQSTGTIGGRFTALQAVAFGALASIGAKAVQVGQQMLSSFSTGPIMQGFQEYETNMNSIQTILANTKQSGTGLKEVNAALDEMNLYSDKTIYNFSEMAKNVGTFTAAGVDLDTATGSIKGIANLAALSGSNSQQAAGAMYQLSQEIAAGKVTLMGWNSVVNAGMGGSVFQRALAETAVSMGKIEKGALKLEGPMKNVSINGKAFRDSISAEGGQESWLSSDVLTNTLQQFTGDLSDAELAAQGFSAAQIASIKETAAMAVGAATEVKTFSGLMDTLKEGVASGWSQSFRIIVGDFEEAKKLFTGISTAVGGFLGGIADRRNELLAKWKEQGGRDALIEGMRAGFEALGRILGPIGQAFRMVFPRKTAEDLVSFTKGFQRLMESLRPGAETFNNIRRTAQGVFSIFSIVITVVKSAAKAFFSLFDGLNPGGKGGAILAFTANIGDFLTNLNRMLKTGDDLDNFFMGIVGPIKVAISFIKDLFSTFTQFFDGISKSEASEAFGKVFDPINEAGNRLAVIGQRIMSVLQTVRESVGDFVGKIKDWLSDLPKMFGDIQWNFNADTIMGALGLGAGVGVGALLAKALKSVKGALDDFSIFGSGGEGMFSSIKDALDGLTGTLKSMQMDLKANALIKIAGAIGIIAASFLVMSGIPAESLIRSSIAMGVMIAQLAGGLILLDKATGTFGAVKLGILGAALIGLASAVLILSFAMKNLEGISWNDIAKGLVTITLFLGALSVAAVFMSGQNQALAKTGFSLLLVAVAIKVLVSAMEDLSSIKWENIGKGIASIVVLLGALGLFSRFAEANKAGLSNGAGILLLAVAIKVLASAVADFAKYNWEELAQGMVGIGAGLALIAGAMFLMPPDGGLSKGLGVLAIAFAMKILAQAIGEFGDLSWIDMAQGLFAMNISLGVIAKTFDSIDKGAVMKAAAILVAAAALKIVASALADMGSLSWNELVKGLLGLNVALLAIAIALNVMQGTLPGAAALMVAAVALRVLFPVIQGFADMSWEELVKGMLGLAGVFLVLGAAAFVLAPLAPVLLVIGAGIALLGVGVVLAAAGTAAFAVALTALAAAGAAGAAAFTVIVTSLIGLIPVTMAALGAGIIAFAVVIGEGAPALIGAFVKVLNALLQAIIDIAPKIGETMLALLNVLLDVITKAVPRMVEAGITILLGFLRGIANNINKVVTTAVDIIVNFLNGITNNLGRIITAGADLIIKFLDGLGREVPRVVEAAMQMVVDIANGIADSIRNNSADLIDAGFNIVDAVIDGIVDGAKKLAGKAVDAVKGVAKGMLDGALGMLGINSPSKVFRERVGMAIPEGIAVGVEKYSHMATDATLAMGRDLIGTMGKTIAGLGDAVDGMGEFQPVITPVLDLSSIKSDAGQIGSILNAVPIDLSGAAVSAGSASAGYSANLEALADLIGENSGVTQTFNQYNNSPKPLSEAELYRGTNNLMSKARRELTNA